MYSLGTLFKSKTTSTEAKLLFEKVSCCIEPIEMKTNFFKYDGLLIEESFFSDKSELYNLILNIKQEKNIHIWMFTNNSSLIDRKVYLKMGIDCIFFLESFPEEFTLYLENQLAYQKAIEVKLNEEGANTNSTEVKKQLLNKSQRIVLNDVNRSLMIQRENEKMKEVYFTKLEYKALKLLSERPNETFSYKKIYEFIWEDSYKKNNCRIANVFHHVRMKLEKDSEILIKTVRSQGYMFVNSEN